MDHRRGRISCHRTCSHSSRSLMKITNQWTKPQFVFIGVFFCVCVYVCVSQVKRTKGGITVPFHLYINSVFVSNCQIGFIYIVFMILLFVLYFVTNS